MSLLQDTVGNIKPLDTNAMQKVKERLDNLTKPVGSLGALEDMAVRLAGIQRSVNLDVGSKAVVVCAADHGVAEEGVSAFPPEVTGQMVINFLNGGAAINVLSRAVGASVVVADVGVNGIPVNHPDLINMRVKNGTDNFTRGPAMSRAEAVAALEAGIKLAQQQVQRGTKVLATGEMGIGNTTASSAVLAAISGLSPDQVTGRGTGVSDRSLAVKRDVIARGLAVNNPDPEDGIDVLAKVGGLEIGALAGLILGGAAFGVPVVVDGFISGAAALVAYKIAPRCKDYMFGSHLSEEPGHRVMVEMLELKPVLRMGMRLGEGTGAVLVFPLLDAAVKVLKEMATFEELAAQTLK
ncbi:nicotinate-nucleotide--dimethylbenzimidazole phosphoribosyltransferase [Desulfohalotomaculum tongense]|uniref:nicotinate-nucleotide--dimethylbenzimidazole phosphoribosyltransferase n=1 Tax=Desulforadius tongensis TaxID=1216062 RepID=UPI00195C4B2A|nr:nicotinate-nucleotide--dimethylbenzimidazole phosphoribosyltransferase [Desulforadius tongensis]MBM7854347.1 nicotinate-nucleotide--dimethylbenzimidazole phosphoribosyltransferase [Desulforadius tongensis]